MANIDSSYVDLANKGFEEFKSTYITLDKDKSGNKYTEKEAKTAFDFYKSLGKKQFKSAFSEDPFGKGTLSSAVDGITNMVVGGGTFGKVLIGLNNVIRNIADVSEKIVSTQMGIEDPNSMSKVIFDLVKEGGINPLKLLASGGEEVFNQLLTQLKQESVLLSEVGAKTGLVTQLGEQLREDMIQASIEGARYGTTLSEIGGFYIDLVNTSGKFSLINQDVYDSAIPLSKVLDMSLSNLATTLLDYENIGVGLNQSLENLEKASISSLSLGLSAKKVVETMRGDISKLNEYGFQNGVRGLERMAQKSLEFRMSMEGVYRVADKVFDPQGALDLVANLQVLGGVIGDFNDPMKLMYMATNNVEGLQDALIDAAGSLATYNDEQGRFEITGINLRRAKAMADELGVSYSELAKGAIASAERTSAASALMSRGLIMKDEDREFLTNLSRMEDGEMKIVIPKSLMDEMGGQTELSLDKLTEAQSNILLANREAFKEMDTKEVAMNQLTQLQQVSRGIDVIAAYYRVIGADFLKDNAKRLGQDMVVDLQRNIDSFSSELTQRAKSEEIKNSSPTVVITSSPIANNPINGKIEEKSNYSGNNSTTTSNGTQNHNVRITLDSALDNLGGYFSKFLVKNIEMANDVKEITSYNENSYLTP